MRTLPIALVAVLTAATPVTAAPAPAWHVDPAHSRIAFRASLNGQPIDGRFRRFDARIAFDPANLGGSSVVAAIDTGSAVTGDASRDESLPTGDWFDVAAFPRATFTARRFSSLGADRFAAIGTLRIRGVDRPVTLPFRLVTVGKVAQMRGTLTIDRRWFGIGQGQFATVDSVAANVAIDVTIRAVRAS